MEYTEGLESPRSNALGLSDAMIMYELSNKNLKSRFMAAYPINIAQVYHL
jgi:hypothetical protein